MIHSLRILLWNVEWACPGSDRWALIEEIIREKNPDVICLTEAYENPIEAPWNWVISNPDYGYHITTGRRKVMLGARQRWDDVDAVGSTSLPSGRFVSGRTQSTQFIGVCIPWKDAHVRTGQKNRAPWEDHKRYLSSLETIIEQARAEPMVLLGDFNQRFPNLHAPADVHAPLLRCVKSLHTLTVGTLDPIGEQAIDHICLSRKPARYHVTTLDRQFRGVRLSDHFGIVADIEF